MDSISIHKRNIVVARDESNHPRNIQCPIRELIAYIKKAERSNIVYDCTLRTDIMSTLHTIII